MISRLIKKYNTLNLQKSDINNFPFGNKPFCITLRGLKNETENKSLIFLKNCLEVFIEENGGNPLFKVKFYMQTGDFSEFADITLCAKINRDNFTDKVNIIFNGVSEIITDENGYEITLYHGLDLICKPEAISANCDFSFYEGLPEIQYERFNENTKVTYFIPYLKDTYAGDVMNFYNDGVYHLMYLSDRYHHGNRFGTGAHAVSHVTTTDFINFTEQKDIVTIDTPWMSAGTGTMFFHNGKYYMTYGIHSERYLNKTKRIIPDHNTDKSVYFPTPFEKIFNAGGIPAGATYAESDDGINFTPSNILFHECRNPSAYVENGKIVLYSGYGADGKYISVGIDKPFYLSPLKFNMLDKAVMRNSSECPSFFENNGYKYLIVGFTGYFRTLEKGSDNFVSGAMLNEEIYDGLNVPMVCAYKDGRKILAGWIGGASWGSIIAHRELVFFDNGALGTKWMPELIPEHKAFSAFDKSENINTENGVFIKSTFGAVNSGKCGFVFSDGENYVTLQINADKKTMQVNKADKNTFGETLESSYVQLKNCNDKTDAFRYVSCKDIALNGINFAVPGCDTEKTENKLLITVKKINRINATVIDAEFNGYRTLISVRKNFFPNKVTFVSEIKNATAEISELK